MEIGVLDIDHLMVGVPDSAAAGDALQRLGFAVTARSILPGLSNRLVCFDSPRWAEGVCNYIELMALDDAASAPPPMPKVLSVNGPVSLVLSIADARAAHDALAADGMATTPAIDLKRDWVLPSGETIVPQFSVVIPAPGQAPFYWNLCQHRTPQHYVRPEFTRHPNGATRLSAVLAVAPDPPALEAHFRRFWKARRVADAPLTLAAGDVALRIFAPAELAAAFPGIAVDSAASRLIGFAVGCAAPAAARRLLGRAGIAAFDGAFGFHVRPEDAAGALVLFEPG